jgi:hypothetical protein
MKTNWKGLVLVGLISSASTLAGFKLLGNDSDRDVIFKEAPSESINRFTSTGAPVGAPGDFVYAAEATTPTVVHIKSTMTRQASEASSRSRIYSKISLVMILAEASGDHSLRKLRVQVLSFPLMATL